MVDSLRFKFILGFLFVVLFWLVLDEGGKAFSGISLILIISFPLGLFFNTISPKIKNLKLFLPLLIFLLISLLATILSVSKYESYVYFIYLFSLILIFFIISQLSFPENYLKVFFYFILGLSVVVSIISAYFFLTTSIHPRMSGTFYWPNPLAGFLLFGLPVSLSLFWQNQKRGQKILLLLACALILAVFVLTYSKGGYLSFLLPLSLLVFHFRSTLKKEFLVKIVLLIFLATALVFGFLNLSKLPTHPFLKIVAQEEGQATSLTRLAYYKGALSIFLDNKWLGTGPTTFGTVYPQYQKSPAEYSKNVHNFYLETLSETGIFGFLAFLAFVLSLLFAGFKLLKSQFKAISLPLFAGVLGSLTHSGVDFDFSYPAVFLCFWLFSGLLLGLFMRIKPKESPLKFHWLIFLFSFFLFILGIFLFLAKYHMDMAKSLKSDYKIEEAKIHYQKGLNFLNKNPRIYYNVGKIDLLLGNQKEAEESAKKAVLKNPSDCESWQLLGQVYFTKGEFDKAEENFKKAISLSPLNYPDFYIDLASVYLKLNQKDKAKETAQTILSHYSEEVTTTLHLKPNLPDQIELLKTILKEAEK